VTVMSYNLLLLFVEGNDDELFFREVILPLLDSSKFDIKIWKYRQDKAEKTASFMNSACKMGRYFFFSR
jgi:hypothetical protein